MALTEPSLRATTESLLGRRADRPLTAPRLTVVPAESKPSYDASPAAYRRLRRAVIEAGLLDRRYGYYLGRTLLSFAFVAAAVTWAFVVPSGLGWSALVVLALGFGFAQVAMIGHDSGHHAVFRRARPNWTL